MKVMRFAVCDGKPTGILQRKSALRKVPGLVDISQVFGFQKQTLVAELLARAGHKDLRKSVTSNPQLSPTMLSWSVTFLVIALIAALLGFTGIAGTAVGIAKILFLVFLVLFVLSLIFGRKRV